MKHYLNQSGNWKKVAAILVVINLVCFSQLHADEEGDARFFGIYNEMVGDRFYRTREIPGNKVLAVSHYKKALKFSENNADLQWKITRCFWFLADEAVERVKREGYFRDGISYGKAAIKSDPDNSNAHLWYGLIVGSEAIDRGIVNSLYKRDRIKKELNTALSLNPKNTNAYVGLASWYFHVPAVLGGDREKAMKMINRAIAIEPNYTTARMQKTEFLIEDDRIEEARKELKAILMIKDSAIRSDGVANRIKAELMLKEIGATEGSK